MVAKRQQAHLCETVSGRGPDVRFIAGRLGMWSGVMAGLALLTWGMVALLTPATLPITTVRVEGRFHHVSAEQVRTQVVGMLRGGFFGVNVDAVQRRIKQMPWVASASVRRIWPATVAIDVNEQHPLARWGAGGLINVQGKLFQPPAGSDPAGLPELIGPVGSEAMMSARYREVRAMLRPLGLKVARLMQNARRAWSVQLDNGMELVLGRADSLVRLHRFVEVWPRVLVSRQQDIVRVDLRYTNGFAVLWKPGTTTGQG